MATCPTTYGLGKDSNANFVNQLRDASDVTRMKRQQGARRNYQVLSRQYGKGLTPIGGISHTDFYDMAHTTQSFGPSNVVMSGKNYTAPSCTPCGSTSFPPFNTLVVSLSLIRY
jgi:hypothetical protein